MAKQTVNIDVEIGTKDLVTLDSLLKETGVSLKAIDTDLQDVGDSVGDVVAGLGEVGAGAKDIAKVEDAAMSAAKGAGKLADETKKVGKASKDAGKEATIFGDIKDKFNDMTKGVKKVIVSMKTLKGAIAATGVGALVVALGTLIAYFKTSEEGSRKLAIATETISLLFGELTEFAASLGKTIVDAFNNPLESIKNLGKAIVDNLIFRFNSLIEGLGLAGKAIAKFFKRDFEGAMSAAKEAGSKFTDTITGVEDSITKVGEVGTKVFKEVKKAVEEATVTATKLVNAQRALRDLQQELTVENAKLNKELEGQKRIAEDTTLDYETRRAALDEVNKIQLKLAENVAIQAKAEEDLLKTQIANEANYEKREELETQLADITASRIEAETTLQTVKLEGEKVARELETGEVDRKREINDILQGLNLEAIEDTFAKARAELDIQQQADRDLLIAKGATAEQLAQLDKRYGDKRKKLAKDEAEFNKKLEQEALNAKLNNANQALGAIVGAVGEGSALGKAAAAGQAVINTYQAITKALADLGPIFGPIAATAIGAMGFMNVQKILTTKVPGDDTAGAPSMGGAPGASQINVGSIGQGQTQAPEIPTVQPTVRAYVISGDVSSSQEAEARLNRRRSLG